MEKDIEAINVFLDLIESIDKERERIGWTKSKCIQYISNKYGKKSRLYLSDEQLLELYAYFQSLPSKKVIGLPKIGIKKSWKNYSK